MIFKYILLASIFVFASCNKNIQQTNSKPIKSISSDLDLVFPDNPQNWISNEELQNVIILNDLDTSTNLLPFSNYLKNGMVFLYDSINNEIVQLTDASKNIHNIVMSPTRKYVVCFEFIDSSEFTAEYKYIILQNDIRRTIKIVSTSINYHCGFEKWYSNSRVAFSVGDEFSIDNGYLVDLKRNSYSNISYSLFQIKK